jgi:tRNA (pseudouridine54-N1)-methyltransferase
MNIIFFIKSSSVDITNYTIKDIPGSSGRFDVISRSILSALLRNGGFERNVQIWTFLENYGTFIFNSNLLDYENFPKNEILLTDNFIKLIEKIKGIEKNINNPLPLIEYSDINIFDAIKQKIKEGFSTYVLNENGEDFFKYKKQILLKINVLFVVGSQSGETIDSYELQDLNLPNISIGNKSYLASSVIRLIKLNLML